MGGTAPHIATSSCAILGPRTLSGLSDSYFFALRDFLHGLKFLLNKEFTISEIDLEEKKFHSAMAKLEELLPAYWNTISRHLLLLAHDDIRDMGALTMLWAGRFHPYMRRIFRFNSRNPAVTAARKWTLQLLKMRYEGCREGGVRRGMSGVSARIPLLPLLKLGKQSNASLMEGSPPWPA